MANYFNNDDLQNWTGLPVYESSGISGLQIQFTSESEYVEPYSLTEFRIFARIDFDTDDSLLELFLKAARIDVERYLQKSLGVRTIQLTALKLPNNYLLPYGPVASVSTSGYTLVGDIVKKSTGSANITLTDVTIEYVTNANLVNDSIKNAIYKQAYNYYENRDKYLEGNKLLGQLVNEVKLILAPFRNVVFP